MCKFRAKVSIMELWSYGIMDYGKGAKNIKKSQKCKQFEFFCLFFCIFGIFVVILQPNLCACIYVYARTIDN